MQEIIVRRRYGLYTCQNKAIFRTREMAWKKSLHYFIQFGEYQTPYQCKYCPYFHLTAKRAVYEPSKYFVKYFNRWYGSRIL